MIHSTSPLRRDSRAVRKGVLVGEGGARVVVSARTSVFGIRLPVNQGLIRLMREAGGTAVGVQVRGAGGEDGSATLAYGL